MVEAETVPRTARVGRPAPDFTGEALLPDLDFAQVSLSQYRGKWIILFTWALDFSIVCPTEILTFNERYDEFRKLDCQLIGLSTDSVYSHLAWTGIDPKEGGIGSIKFPLIGDLGGRISQPYGFFDYRLGHNFRGTTIIDPDGILLHVSLNPFEVGRNVDDVFRLLKGLQFARTHPPSGLERK
jgi:alkyl hydroperoxide reductase subunit AhpC